RGEGGGCRAVPGEQEALERGWVLSNNPNGGRNPRRRGPRSLDPPLPQRVAEHVLCNTKEPGKRRRSVLIAEPTSAEPGPREDFGCQIGGMLANPCPRPGKHLTDVPVIHLGERLGITRSEGASVRRLREVGSHNLYSAAPRTVCQCRQGSRSSCHAQGAAAALPRARLGAGRARRTHRPAAS